MKKLLVIFVVAIATSFSSQAFGQLISSLDFGAGDGFTFPTFGSSDIVNGVSGQTASGPISFDIYSGISTGNVTEGTDGIDDISFSFGIIQAFDVYGAGALNPLRGVGHDLQQSGSGLQGRNRIGDVTAAASTTGDVVGFSVTVEFGDHLTIRSENVGVLLNSVNTAGEAFEASSVVFLDHDGNPFGAANYTGFYDAAPLGAGAGGTADVAINSDPFEITGTGVYVADNTDTVDITDRLDPVAGSTVPSNNFDPNAALDAGLADGTLIGGFTFTTFLEDVANTEEEGVVTTTETSFTSTLNGVELVVQTNVVPEPSSLTVGAMVGLTFLVRRRRQA